MLTSLATTSARPRPAYRVFAATAARVVHLGSTFTRVSFTGDDLADFGTAGFDQRIKLVFPHPATGFEDFPRSEDWYQLWRELPAARQNAFRTYTVRHVRPDVREVDVEFALHGDHGPATRWASRVRVGDPILIIGPDERSPDRTVGIDFRPGSVERLLIAGDETAAPAICAILEQVPRNARGIALIDVPHAADALVVNAPAKCPATDSSRLFATGSLGPAARRAATMVRRAALTGRLRSRAMRPQARMLRSEISRSRTSRSGMLRSGMSQRAAASTANSMRGSRASHPLSQRSVGFSCARPDSTADRSRLWGTGGAVAPKVNSRLRAAPRTRRIVVCAVCVLALGAAIAASLLFGTRAVSAVTVWQALTNPDTADPGQQVVTGLRVPRTIIGIIAGAILGLAGTLSQGVSRNPLADPGLLGMSAGASLAVVVAIAFCGITSPAGYIWFAFVGTAAAASLVFSIGRGQPARVALAGAALTALLTPLIGLILLRNTDAFNQYRFWAMGSLTGRDLSAVSAVWPFAVLGVLLALGMVNRLNLLALGDDVARSLGQRVGFTHAVSGISLILLCGVATALAGPLALIGLVGHDYRWIGPLSLVLGSTLLLGADTIGRLVVPNTELEAGVVTAFLGAPILIAIARSRRVAGL